MPNSLAQPSVAGRNPVSIFMVVDLPQPFEPRKPKISPRRDAEVDMIDGDEVAEPPRQSLGLDCRHFVRSLRRAAAR